MVNIEKRIVIDESTERVFRYMSEPQTGSAARSGLVEVRDVHRLIDGVSYMNQIYAPTGVPTDGLNIQLQFEADQRARLKQRHDVQMIMMWDFQPDRLAAPRLALDGDHTHWSLC